MSVSIILSTYESPDTLRLVLLALARQTALPDEVLVADDGSSAATREMLQSAAAALPFPLAHVWQPHEGFRLARSRNNAMFRAKGAFLLFLDQDALPCSRWVAAHAAVVESGSVSVGHVVPLPETTVPTADDIAAGRLETLPTAEQRRALARLQRRLARYAWLRRLGIGIKNKPRVFGGNFALAREDALRINGFDEAFVGWGQEDDDLGRRLYRIGILPRIVVETAVLLHIAHPPRHPKSWKDGANVRRYHAAGPVFCYQGLNAHPHPDVRISEFASAKGADNR
jgi:GT2 family glycosyltransferase